MENRENYTLLPNSDRHNCFGCSLKNTSGLHMEFYTNKEMDVVVSWYSVPEQFCGWGTLVHGGIVSTMLDEAMGWGALVILQRLILSKSIAVDFIKPVFSGTKIRVEGGVLSHENEKEAVLKGCIYNDNNEICAKATSVASLFTIESVKKMGVVDAEMLKGLEQLINDGITSPL